MAPPKKTTAAATTAAVLAPKKTKKTAKVVAAIAPVKPSPKGSVPPTREPGVHKSRSGKNHGVKHRFAPYIKLILSDIYPEMNLGRKAKAILCQYADDRLDQLAETCRDLLAHDKRKTLDCTHLESAVKLTFPPELAKHAISEATKASVRYSSSQV